MTRDRCIEKIKTNIRIACDSAATIEVKCEAIHELLNTLPWLYAHTKVLIADETIKAIATAKDKSKPAKERTNAIIEAINTIPALILIAEQLNPHKPPYGEH